MLGAKSAQGNLFLGSLGDHGRVPWVDQAVERLQIFNLLCMVVRALRVWLRPIWS